MALDTLSQEIGQGARRLRSAPGFTLAVVSLIALGVGAATAIFSVVETVLLTPLAPDADRTFVIYPRDVSHFTPYTPISLPDFSDWRRRSTSFEELAAFGQNVSSFAFEWDRGSIETRAGHVTATFFETLGQKPILGRGFIPEDERPDADRVVVLSYGLWQSEFGGEEEILGKKLKEEAIGVLHTVVGVMPPSFDFPRGARIWRIARDEPPFDQRGLGVFVAVGRLRPDVPAEQARSEMEAVDRGVIAETRFALVPRAIEIVPLMEFYLGKATLSAVWMLELAVGLVFLMACANLAGLVMARSQSHRRDIAIRVALGATRVRLARVFLAEAAFTMLAGGLLGVLLAGVSLQVILSRAPAAIPRLSDAELDARALFFAVLAAAAASVWLGIVPALSATRRAASEALGGTSRVGAPLRLARVRQGWIVFQVAVSSVLVLSASLLMNSFVRLSRAGLGYTPERLLLFGIKGPHDLLESTGGQRLVTDLMERMSALGDVSSVAALISPPLREGRGAWDWWFVAENQGFGFAPRERVDPETGETVTYYGPPPEAFEQNFGVHWLAVSGSYFKTMGIPLLRGRTFSESDDADAPRVVIVGRSFAERLWPGEDPIGKRIITYGFRYDRDRRAEWQVVVGVVADARYQEIDRAGFDVYVPYRQSPLVPLHFAVRTIGPPLAAVEGLRGAAREADPRLSMAGIRTMAAEVARELTPRRFETALVTVLAVVALVLAGLGVFGIVAYGIARRAPEIALRRALGAGTKDVLSLAIGQAMKPALIGLAAGLALAAASARLLAARLYEIAPTDPPTCAIAGAVIVVVAFLASYLPARRAARLDPAVVLRSE